MSMEAIEKELLDLERRAHGHGKVAVGGKVTAKVFSGCFRKSIVARWAQHDVQACRVLKICVAILSWLSCAIICSILYIVNIACRPVCLPVYLKVYY